MRGQSALEYLIMIIAVLAVAAIVVLFTTGALGTQKQAASFEECRTAAADCAKERLMSPESKCMMCDGPCSGKYAVYLDLCKKGKVEDIYEPVCLNGKQESYEQCDGANLNDKTCRTQGFGGGTLTCTSQCTFDTIGCYNILCSFGTDCEDNNICTVDVCINPGTQSASCSNTPVTCQNGDSCCSPGCNANNDNDCPVTCNNNITEGSEVCDGTDLRSETCVTRGFDGGTLSCASGCVFDTTSCWNYWSTVLIADTGNNQVIEVNSTGNVVWSMITGLITPFDADRLLNGNTLIADFGNNRVIEVNSTGSVIWSITGLNQPIDADRLTNGNTLIADYGNNRVIEVNSSGNITWNMSTGLNYPEAAHRLLNGNTLITDKNNLRVIEVNSSGSIVWSITGLNYPADAHRLLNGNTLIADYNINRTIEVNSSGSIVWSKTGLHWPTDAERLTNGNTLIADKKSNQIIEVNSAGTTVWSMTGLNQPWSVQAIY